MKKCLFAALGFLVFGLGTTAAIAGQNVGNGGAVVTGTCDGVDRSRNVTLLLDYWELAREFGLQPELGAATDSVDIHLEVAFTRLERLDPVRADIYRQWYRDFWQEAVQQEPGISLPALSDLGVINPPLPAGCSTNKIIEQVTPISEFLVKRFYIRQAAFAALDMTNQAGLILHELVYRDALSRGHETSMKARVVTGLMSSSVFSQWTVERYEGFMVEQGLIGYMVNITVASGIKRYFDHRPLSLENARIFCAQLKGDSRMAQGSDFSFAPSSGTGIHGIGNFYRESAIGHRILGSESAGSVEFFLGDGPILANNDGSSMSQSPLSSPRAFLCWQEEAASPWTKK